MYPTQACKPPAASRVVLPCLLLAACTAVAAEGLLPLDGRWEHPHFLTWRPGNGQVCAVNPPRLSWPYVPHVVIDRKTERALRTFTLQLSRSGDFAKPDIEVRTPYNFYNALPVLARARWHWRVGYDTGKKGGQWSPVRTFAFAPDAVEWDRTFIERAAGRLAALKHPRLGPPGGDWQAWRAKLAAGQDSATWLTEALKAADRATRQPWWREPPTTDRKGETPYDEREFGRIATDAALASFAYRLTGDAKYAKAKELALALARLPKGGLASPEYHGQVRRKWPTQLTDLLAVCYDLWHDDLTGAERTTLLGSVAWRMRATYLVKQSWRTGDTIAHAGVGVFAQSHPYENFVWSLPAVLLTAGDLAVADKLVPLCLHYLTGVTAAHGPDEAWNEGNSYATAKGQSMLCAAMYTALLLPELKLGRSPCLARLNEWYAHLLPIGLNRLSFGDYAASAGRRLGGHRANARFIAWLTGDGRAERRWRAVAAKAGNRPSRRPWLDLLAATRLTLPQPADEAPHAVFPEAGWVMASTHPPSDAKGFADAVGMIFACRPRGGYSHSYRCENDFVWHAYGQTLSAGGGGTAYPDPHSRHSMSHNVVMVNGQGQEWDSWHPKTPFCGRLLAWREGKGFVHWVGDATHAYQSVPGLLRWHRHVVLAVAASGSLAEKRGDRQASRLSLRRAGGGWFAVFDDLAMRPDAVPARFSWLFHVAPKVPMTLSPTTTSFAWQMADVHARVALSCPREAVDVVNMAGRKGFVNPITGNDMYEATLKRLARKDRKLPEKRWMAHNMWITNRQPARQMTFLAALTAWREGQPQPKVAFRGDRAVTVTGANGAARTVSFDPKAPGDITVDVEKIRQHAAATDPTTLPPNGRVETLKLAGDKYRVEWLARETFDRADWPSRWFVEGDSEVAARDGKLWVRKLDPKSRNVATIWYRPELPADAIVRFRAKAVEPAEENAANLNLFLHARERDGSPVRFGRSGQYKEYHAIPNYIVTLVGGCRPGWSRARRDPGFRLLHEADVRSEVGREYRIAVAIQGGRLRYYLDGKRLHDVADPEPLPGGRFAIRTWSTNAWWADIEFGRILPSAGAKP